MVGPTDQKRLGQVNQLEAFWIETRRSAESHRWIIGGFGDADLRIGLGHQALVCGDVRAALQKLRGNAKWNGWRGNFQGLDRDREGGSRFTD